MSSNGPVPHPGRRWWMCSTKWPSHSRHLVVEKKNPVWGRRISAVRVEGEVQRFLNAVRAVGDEIRRTRRMVEMEHGPDLAQIFDAHLHCMHDDYCLSTLGDDPPEWKTVDACGYAVYGCHDIDDTFDKLFPSRQV